MVQAIASYYFVEKRNKGNQMGFTKNKFQKEVFILHFISTGVNSKPNTVTKPANQSSID
jgi:hypothetical protein